MKIKVLLAGSETKPRFDLLLKLKSFRSENVISALKDHLVDGVSETAAAALNSVDIANFRRSLSALEDTASIVEQIKEIDERNTLTTNKKESV